MGWTAEEFSSILVRGKKFSPQSPYCLCCPRSLLFYGWQGFLFRGKATERAASVYLYLVTRSRNEWKCRSTYTTPSDFMVCTDI